MSSGRRQRQKSPHYAYSCISVSDLAFFSFTLNESPNKDVGSLRCFVEQILPTSFHAQGKRSLSSLRGFNLTLFKDKDDITVMEGTGSTIPSSFKIPNVVVKGGKGQVADRTCKETRCSELLHMKPRRSLRASPHLYGDGV